MASFDPIPVKGTPINVSLDANPPLEDNKSYYMRNEGPNDIEFMPEARTVNPTADDIKTKGFTLPPGAQIGFTDDRTDYFWIVSPPGSELRVARAVTP